MAVTISFLGLLLFAWMFSQTFKTFLNFCTTRRFKAKMLLSDGDFPSTHTTVSITAVIAICYKLLPIINGTNKESSIIASMLVVLSVIWALYIIRDALGIRLRVQELSTTVYNILTKSKGVEANSPISSNLQEFWSGLATSINLKVGHMPHEVIGGVILGIIFGIGSCALFSHNISLFFFDFCVFVIYTIITIVVIGRKKK